MSGISLPYIVTPSTATGLTAIPSNNLLGNVSSVSALPAAVTQAQLNALINPVSTSVAGIVPHLTGNASDYFAGDGNFTPLPTIPPQDFVFLGSQTASTAGVSFLSFTGISNTYPLYQFRFRNITVASGGASLGMQVTTDNGATWYGSTSASLLYVTAFANISGASSLIVLTSGIIAANAGVTGHIEMGQFGLTAQSNVLSYGQTAFTGGQATTIFSGCPSGTIAAVNGMRIVGGAGALINGGTIRMYGLAG